MSYEYIGPSNTSSLSQHMPLLQETPAYNHSHHKAPASIYAASNNNMINDLFSHSHDERLQLALWISLSWSGVTVATSLEPGLTCIITYTLVWLLHTHLNYVVH